MHARIRTIVARSGAVFCGLVFCFLVWYALFIGAVPTVGPLPVLPGLTYVLPWELSRWFDPLGAAAMIALVAAVCGSSLTSSFRSAAPIGAGLCAGATFELLCVSYLGFAGTLLVYGFAALCLGFGAAVGTAQQEARVDNCLHGAYTLGIGLGMGSGIVVAISHGTVVAFALVLVTIAVCVMFGALCVVLLSLLSYTPSVGRGTFRWLAGN